MAKVQTLTDRVERIVSLQNLADWFGQHGHKRVRVRRSILHPDIISAYLPYRLTKWDAAFLLQLAEEHLVIGSPQIRLVGGFWAWLIRGVIGLGH